MSSGLRSRRSPQAAEAADVEIATGDTKVVERGHADGMYICTAGIGKVDPRGPALPARNTAGRPHHRLGHGRRPRLGDHARARRVLARRRDPLRHPAALAGGRRAARRRRSRAPLHARRDAGRGRLGPQRAGAGVGRGDQRARGRRPGQCRRSRAPRRCSGSTRCTSPTRESLWPSSRRIGRRQALEALRSVSGCEQAAEIGEVKSEPPGMVLVETAFGGKRVMDQLVGDPLPRIC